MNSLANFSNTHTINKKKTGWTKISAHEYINMKCGYFDYCPVLKIKSGVNEPTNGPGLLKSLMKQIKRGK